MTAPATGNYLLVCTASPNQPTADQLDVGPRTSSHDIVMVSHPG